MKPFVTYENRIYELTHSIAHIPRRKKELMLKPYQSAIIEDLSQIDIVLSDSTFHLFINTLEAISKLDGYAKDKFTAFPILLLRTEALSSSQIEHYHASNRSVALAQLNKKHTKEAKIIQSNLDALIKSTSEDRNIDLNFIEDIHGYLMGDSTHKDDLGIRKVVNWIGVSNLFPHEADYVPPHPDHLNVYLSQLIKFINRNDLHPLILSAFAQAYFEIIHPFIDGNGRVGRILIQIILHRFAFTENIFIPISVSLVKNTKRYVDSLNAFKEGYYEEAIQVILQSILDVIPHVYRVLETMIEMKQGFLNKIKARSDALVWQIIDDIFMQPVIDVDYIKRKHKANDQAVRNNIEILLNAGILTKIGNNMRDVTYECKQILSILDGFAVI